MLLVLWQASWRKIQQLRLVPLYKNDDDFRLFCGMMDGLAFLLVPDLTNGIHLLRTIGFIICWCSTISFRIVFLTIKNYLCMSVYKHYDNSNQVASFYKLPIQLLGSHTITLPMIQSSSTQKCHKRPGLSLVLVTPETNPARSLPRLCPPLLLGIISIFV
jgi:hypothetical protein